MTWAQFNHIQLLRYAGLFQYASVGTPFLRYRTVVEDLAAKQLPGSYVHLWLGCYVVFGIVYWYLTRDLGTLGRTPLRRGVQIALLVVLNLMAVAIGWFSQSGISALLLAVVAVVLPWLVPLRVGIAWMVLQNFSLVPVFASIREPAFSLSDAFLQSSLYSGFIVLAFVTALVTKQQVEAREEQRRLNSELRATRALLAESSRLAERMRISRELHDLMGHHLTALSLNLEVASHLVDGPAQKHILQAQSVAKLLLGDVREVVSQLREGDSIDLTQALRDLVEGVPGLAIHLQLPARLGVDDPRRAQVLLRCAQEIITNTVRHAQARNLWLVFEHDARREVAIRARDDGRGASALVQGNGLAGMRERLAQFGGRVDIDAGAGRGFALDIILPLESDP
ncbi:MAG: sensor histidine kinase [Dokdonella sp.]|uniref:sensor histidine kinase n=1 Tax=Dokdonella sp. TaxID=2291710 RepID=UPI0025BB7E3E|nr:histidine kinase [Dokdonella sp.]MBX3699396.1 sensor histidine kinase [Dokdonella sp.]